MKSTYEARALKFARLLAILFAGCEYLSDFEYAIECYNRTHSRKLHYAHGVSRIAIIRSDYVIKFDFIPTGSFSKGQAGNIDSELRVYSKAVADGMAHLLAKTTVGEYDGLKYAIMPRVNGINKEEWCWWEHCSEDEYDWLSENVNDLHEGNLGYRHGKVCVIDYAWDAVNQPGQSSGFSWNESPETSSESLTSAFSGANW